MINIVRFRLYQEVKVRTLSSSDECFKYKQFLKLVIGLVAACIYIG